jgi:hypothetical protein
MQQLEELEMIVFRLAALVTMSTCHCSRLENKTDSSHTNAINITKKSIMINVYSKFHTSDESLL